MSSFLTLDHVNVTRQNVVVRLDLNIPVKNQHISDETRIVRSLTTIKELLDKEAKVIILSHFGRPKGQASAALSLAPVARILKQHLSCPVSFADNCIGEAAAFAIRHTPYGGVVVLENLRFHDGEEENSPAFAEHLARLGDLFVNDAFSCSHRAHASVVGIGDYLPVIAGRAMEAELRALESILTTPKRPVMAIAGGSKVSTKLELLTNLISKVDYLVLGGGMANTFLLAQGQDIGESLAEPDLVPQAQAIINKAKTNNCTLILPEDYVCPEESFKIMDIGPRTVTRIQAAIDDCKTIVWNGPVGVFEVPPFDKGSVALAQYIATKTQTNGLISVAGGGDTLACLNKAGVGAQFTYTSTAGGAFLEWLEGKTLAGISMLLSGGKRS
ncbi:phosphoglycerate kinase [Candidatus Odyssella thessalonicensis]|uniref:phosphoglycerate kinase n=1 Tax=Candidatus Odyssella thessalonicensis TaxID=84647 RepID=UPI000225C065|nr:phosphoglycerate kinase [Candidatus Odyssella thessalonicensis]